MKIDVPEYILNLKPYVPGKPLEELEREYGIKDSIKLASNENPLGPSPMAVRAIQKHLHGMHRYPDASGHDLISAISRKINISSNNIVLGNGSDEIIAMLAGTFLRPGDEVILPVPSFLMYEIIVRCAGAKPIGVPLNFLSIDLKEIQKRITSGTRMIFLCNPNNPTGTIVSKKEFENFLGNIPQRIIIVVDEAYIEFVQDKNCAQSMAYLNQSVPIVTLRTFSKVYGLAGLRIGYGIMPEKIAGFLNRVRLPFNASSLAQAGAVTALKDIDFLARTIKLVHEELDFLYDALDGIGIEYFPTQTNFFLINVKKNADEVFEKMLRQGVIVRSMTSYGYPCYIRINVGLHRENVRFVDALKNSLM